MHAIIDKKFYLGPKFGILINKKWITISELLQKSWAMTMKMGQQWRPRGQQPAET
jgi:hypothetical protein